MKIFKTYNKIKHFFVPLKLRCYIGKHVMGLPIYKPKCKIYICHCDVVWKDKYSTPRFEFAPQWNLIFFNWQIIFWLTTNDPSDEDEYWEQALWMLYYSNNDLEKAKNTWNWEDMLGNSTWDDKFLRNGRTKNSSRIK